MKVEGTSKIPIHHGILLGGLTAGLLIASVSAFRIAQKLLIGTPAAFLSYPVLGSVAIVSIVLYTFSLMRLLHLWRSSSWTSVSLAPYRLGLYFLVVGTVCFLLWFQPFDPLFFSTYWAFFGACFGALLSVAVTTLERSPVFRVVDLTLFNVCLVLISFEVSLRVLGEISEAPIFAGSQDDRLLERNRLEPGRLRFGFPVNSQGFYDIAPTAIPGTKKLVACIGDSFSTSVVPHPFHYTTVAEGLLPDVEIYNAGVSAVGPPEYQQLLLEVLPLNPDIIVIAIFVGNDIEESFVRRFQGSTKQSSFVRMFDFSELRVYVVSTRLLTVFEELSATSFARSLGWVPGERKQFATEPTPEELLCALPWLQDPNLEQPTFSRKAFLSIESNRALRVCQPSETDKYRAIFDDLIELRRMADGIPLAVLLIPDTFQIDDPLWREITGDQKLDRFMPQRVLGAWLSAQEFPYLDLLPGLRAVARFEDGWSHLYHHQDTHFNRRGNERAGELLAKFLRELLNRQTVELPKT